MCWLQELGGYLGNLILAVIGTFIGAYAAFALEKNSREAERTANKANEGNLANLTLFQIWNDLRQYQKEHIETLKGHPDAAWLELRATFPREVSPLEINANALAFLFEGKDKNLLPDILLEQIRYRMAIAMINRRTEKMIGLVYPRMEAIGMKPNEKIDSRVVAAALGPALTTEVKDLTSAIISHVNENLISLKITSEKLRKQLTELLPNQIILKIGFDEVVEKLED